MIFIFIFKMLYSVIDVCIKIAIFIIFSMDAPSWDTLGYLNIFLNP